MNPDAVPIDDLLIHADFVRSLARDLVRDPHAADDLAQDVWVQALQKPPRHGGSPRGWLATLLHNVRSNRRRDERRRAARERHAAEPEAMPSPEEILGREQVRERLVRAVLRLDEPFRTAVLLRYYEDLPGAAIAQRLGVPAATVRTRLARGLARLRDELDADSGERRAWLGPLAGWAATRSGDTAAVVAAGTVMKKIGIVLAAAILLLSFVFVVPWRDEPAPAVPTSTAALGQPVSPAERDGVLGNAPQREVATAGVPIDAAPVPVFPAERGLGVIVGDVVDDADEPIADVEVIAEPAIGTLGPRMQMRDDRTGRRSARTDAAGRFRLEGVEAGPTAVRAVLTGARRASATAIVAADREEGPVRLRARSSDPRDWLRVVVVDGQERPVPGAAVEVHAWATRGPAALQATDSRTEPVGRGVTGADGAFELPGLGLRSGIVCARTGSEASGMASFDTWAHDHESRIDVRVVLAPSGSLHGTLVGVDADALAGSVVSLHALPQIVAYHCGGGRRFDARVERGAFHFEGLAAGAYGITLSAPSGVRLVVEPMSEGPEPMPNSAVLRKVEVASGVATDVELSVAPGGRLRGAVSCGGRPVAGARVRAVLAPLTSNFPAGFVLRGAHVWRFDNGWEGAPGDPQTHVEGTSDSAGTYELRSLQPGNYRVEVVANGLSFDRRMGVAVADGAVASLAHELVAAGVLQFAAHGLTYVGVTPVGATTPTMLAIVGAEFVTLPGLAPGKYHVARFHSDPSVEPVVLATAEVFAGRTTWLDLRAQSIVEVVTGRVMVGDEPVAGADVRLFPASATTDAFGAFRLAYPYPVRRGANEQGIWVRWRGVTTSFAIPASEGTTLELGRRYVTIDTIDGSGMPIEAQLELSTVRPEGAAGILNASVERRLPAVRGTRIGPLPDWPLRGQVVFAGGVRVPLALPVGTDSIAVTCPPTGTVRVRVSKKDGKPGARVHVAAYTWRGAGEAPADDGALRGDAYWCETRADEHGLAEFVVPAGETLLVLEYNGTSHRVSVATGATAPVEMTLPW